MPTKRKLSRINGWVKAIVLTALPGGIGRGVFSPQLDGEPKHIVGLRDT
jgi:hypothetical protein